MSIASKIRGLGEILQFDNRVELLLARTIFKNSTAAKVYKHGELEIIINQNASDHISGRTVLFSDEYRSLLHGLKTPPPLVVLDLGANIGGFTLLLKLLSIPIQKVVCVE